MPIVLEFLYSLSLGSLFEGFSWCLCRGCSFIFESNLRGPSMDFSVVPCFWFVSSAVIRNFDANSFAVSSNVPFGFQVLIGNFSKTLGNVAPCLHRGSAMMRCRAMGLFRTTG